MSEAKLSVLTAAQRARYEEYLSLDFLPKSAYMMAILDYTLVRSYI